MGLGFGFGLGFGLGLALLGAVAHLAFGRSVAHFNRILLLQASVLAHLLNLLAVGVSVRVRDRDRVRVSVKS